MLCTYGTTQDAHTNVQMPLHVDDEDGMTMAIIHICRDLQLDFFSYWHAPYPTKYP